MNTTNRDILELRRRLKKTECTFGRMCGCYVNGNKKVVLKFGENFLDLKDEEFYKYLEIAKKSLSGTLGNNLLELNFAHSEDAKSRQQFLLTLKSSKLKNDDLLDRLYEQIIEQFSYAGNYLILVFHDVYDVPARTSDRAKIDESEEIYEYMLCAVCPVELSKPGLGYCASENRIGVRERDWVVSLPELGFLYPAFIDRGSDTNAVLYYVKNGKDSHPEFMTDVLGCLTQRTAAEERTAFHEIIKDAVGEDPEQADEVILKVQKTINGMVATADEPEEPVVLTRTAVSDVIAEAAALPEEKKLQIERAYAHAFGDTPPAAQHLLDEKMLAASERRDRTEALQKEVCTLKEQLAEKSTAGEIILQVPADKADQIKAQMIEGHKCLVIPVEDGQAARINGKSTAL